MGDILVLYIIKSIIVSGILYAYYHFALRNKKFHTYNRFYLLASVVMSLLIPLINIHWFKVHSTEMILLQPLQGVINSQQQNVQPASHFAIKEIVIACVFCISIVFLLLLFLKIKRIYTIKKFAEKTKMPGFTFIKTEDTQAPFSFLNNLFWKKGVSVTGGYWEKIFRHELMHIKQKHTYDKLFTQVTLCIFWMNPFYWLIQHELSTIHEFVADAAAIPDGDTESFAMMLLQSHNGGSYLHPSHQFFNSSIKRRLTMLTTSKNVRHSYVRRVLALPVATLVIIIFSVKIVRAQTDPKLSPHDTLKLNKVTIQQRNDSLAYVAINYADDSGNPKTLTLKAGYSKNDSAHVNILYDEESGKKREVSLAETREIVKQIIQDPPARNLYIVDGQEYLPENIKKLDPQKINTINVYSGEEAVKRYGDKAKNGVIIFTTK